jgi:transposase InsO family protein
VAQVLAAKAVHCAWGAKKLHDLLWPAEAGVAAPLSVRTVDRILTRHGHTQPQAPARPPLQRFERETCNELWQMDFKGMGKPRASYFPLSVLDDHSRFCLCFEPLPTQTQAEVWSQLWRLFGEFGLPEAILTDNGSCFSGTWSQRPSGLEMQLWRLGIRTVQGRPYHPQTQGKVERFHRTVDVELVARGQALRQADQAQARQVYAPVIHSYNWCRPHEALAMRVPGAVYVPSPRLRPTRLPEHELAEQAIKRKVQVTGEVSYQGRMYRVSKALAGATLEVRAGADGEAFYYANVVVSARPATDRANRPNV